MGMFDSFFLKTLVPCPKCGMTQFVEFQTKEFECLCEEFREGERAAYRLRRRETQEETDEKLAKFDTENAGFKEKDPEVFRRFREIERYSGCLRLTGEYGQSIPDGKHVVYNFCTGCKNFVTVLAVVKDGIFVGIEP